MKPPHEILKLPSRTGANICTQLKYLMIREARSYWRDPASTIAQVAIAVFMGLFLGSINSGAGSSDQPVADVKGSLFLPIIQSFFMGLNGSLLRGIQGRTLFDREHMAGTYGIYAYLFATVIVSIPVNLLCSAILMSLLHLFIGWQGQIMLIWISMFTIQMIGVAWGLTIGFATGDVNIAQSFSPAVIVPQIYLAGFYRSTENMGVWMRWLQWMCGLMYGYKSMLILEFGDEKNHFEHELQEQTDTTSQHMLEFKAFAAKINLPEHYAKEVEAHLASKTQAQRSHMNNKIRDEFFTHNGISRDDPHQDLLFYMLVPLGLFAALCVFAMIALKISALRR